MKRWTLAIAALLLASSPMMAVEKQWEKDGFQIFRCTDRGTGGFARVRAVAPGEFLVFGGVYKGRVMASDYEDAARYACGERD